MRESGKFVLFFALMASSGSAFADTAEYLGAFEVRGIAYSATTEKSREICRKDNDQETRHEDCGKRVHLYRKDTTVILMQEDRTFLLYPAVFHKRFCDSWVKDAPSMSGEELFASPACRAKLMEDGSYFFSQNQDPDAYLKTQILTFSTIGIPAAMKSHQVIRLMGKDRDHPGEIRVHDRVDGAFMLIKAGLNYDYVLKRI